VKRQSLKKLDRELTEYIESLTEGMGRPERRSAMGLYMTGLLLDGERKSIEPIAARLVDSAGEVQAMRQRLQQCVVVSTWDEKEMFGRVGRRIDQELPQIEAFVVDDTGFPKKGKHSVGVARQYSGTLGRIDNCQVATSLHLAGELGSGCIGMRLYLPESWTSDPARCRKAGVPDNVELTPKWKNALSLIDEALAAGVRRHVVLGDSAFGDITEFREELTERGLPYLLHAQGALVVWPPDTTFVVPKRRVNNGRRPTLEQPPPKTKPLSLSALAAQLDYRRVTWREGSRGKQTSRFAAVRVRTAHKHSVGRGPGPEQWLLCEWPSTEDGPSKFFLSSLPSTIPLRELVRLAKLRWRIERDYQEMKGELGLDHFEGRTWSGFHHHAALCSAAHAFLALRRALFPPEQNPLDVVARTSASAAPAAL
jgi:SRSO17 transposase